MLRTTDGGRRWHETGVNDEGLWTHLRLFDTQTGQHASALLQTTDGGRTWTKRFEAGVAAPNTYFNSVRFLSDQIGFVFAYERADGQSPESSKSEGAFFSTRDGGLSWTRVPLKAAVNSCQVVNGEVWCSSGMNILKLKP